MLAMAAGPGAITDASPVSGAGEEEECRRGDNGERLTQQLPGTSDHFYLQRRPGNVAF